MSDITWIMENIIVHYNTEVLNLNYTDVAQLVRAGRLYRQGYGFDPRHQYGSVMQ